jgi:hypothetical protein
MTRTWLRATLVSFGALLLLAAPIAAGGWATASLTDPPEGPVAGQETTIGVEVKQHGETPISWDQLIFHGTNAATGETVLAEGRPEGPAGHYTIDVTFPSEGRWQWTVRTINLLMEAGDPFPAIEVGPAPAGAAMRPTTASATQASAATAGVDPVLVLGIAALSFFGGTLAGTMLRRRAPALEPMTLEASSSAR